MGFWTHLMAAGVGAYVGANYHQHYQMRHLHCPECGKPKVSFFCSHRRGMTQHLDGASGPMTSSPAQQQEEPHSSSLPSTGPGPRPAHWHHWHQQQQYQQDFQQQQQLQQPLLQQQQPIPQQPPTTTQQ